MRLTYLIGKITEEAAIANYFFLLLQKQEHEGPSESDFTAAEPSSVIKWDGQ